MNRTHTITAMIVDDEELAREELKRLLSVFPDVKVVAEAENGIEAIEKLNALDDIDILFLDIEMPGMNGLSVASLTKEHDCMVIFCTAYSEHAVEAFRLQSLDYLVKPINPDHLSQCLDKYKNLGPIKKQTEHIDMESMILLHDGEKVRFTSPATIEKITSMGNYIKVHGKDYSMVVLGTLSSLETRLDSRYFFRINRQCIVNLSNVIKADLGISGGYLLTMQNGEELEVSRRQSHKLKEAMSI